MAFVITPGQLAKRSELYYQLSATIKAGVGLIDALDLLSRNPSAWFFHRPLSALADCLRQGYSFSDALRTLGHWVPEFDIALLEAGEKSGRLDACFQLLSNYYAERAQLARTVMSNLAYPIGLIHFACLINPDALRALLLQGNVGQYLRMVGLPILIIDGFFLLLIFACQGRHGEFWRSLIEKLSRPIPIFGSARRHLALARLAVALEALLNAGVLVIEAWQLAAAASGSPALRRVVIGWKEPLRGGHTPSELLAQSSGFPEMFTSLYLTGEKTGTLDETLRRLHTYYQDSATRKLRALAQWVPRLIYAGIAFYIGFYVVNFWVGYYNNITNVFGQ